MNKKRLFQDNTLWWLEFSIINTNFLNFNFNYQTNIFHLNINKFNSQLYYLTVKHNLLSLLFSNLDINFDTKNSQLFIAQQTFFYDIKILISTKVSKIITTSSIYKGNLWIERELSEFNDITFINSLDSRKLLTNYTYNKSLQYNNFNNIISDLQI